MSEKNRREIGESRETWCCVERMSHEDWDRKERSHHPEIFRSSVFTPKSLEHQKRDSWIKGSVEDHKSRRHFKLSYKTHNIL